MIYQVPHPTIQVIAVVLRQQNEGIHGKSGPVSQKCGIVMPHQIASNNVPTVDSSRIGSFSVNLSLFLLSLLHIMGHYVH